MGAFVLRRALQSPAQSQPKPSRLAFLRVGEQTQSHFGDSSFTCLKCTCCRSVAKLCPILCNPMDYSMPGSLSSTIPQSLLKFMSIESVMPSNHLILHCPPSPPASSLPSIRVFSSDLALCIRCPKYWSFNLSVSPSNEYSELISFRIDWFDLLAVHGDSPESSPTPQFESSNSLALSLIYGPTPTSVHDYWGKKKTKHSFD